MNRPTMNRVWVALLALAALLGLTACGTAAAGPELTPTAEPTRTNVTTSATVVAVVDGDTVKLDDGRTVRVLGIDTPETVAPRRPVECYGPEATAFAERELLGVRVRVAADDTQDATDRYGRTLAYLLLPDGRNYSVAAADAGVATSYVYDNRPVADAAAIVAAELSARVAGRGLWGACSR